MPKLEDAPKFKVPKTEAEVADRWFTIMNARLDLNRQAKKLEEEEKFLKGWIIDNLPRSRATGIAGKLVQVTITDKIRYETTDWDATYEWIGKNRSKGGFNILNRALNATSLTEYFAAGKKIPGVEQVSYKSLSYKALGKA